MIIRETKYFILDKPQKLDVVFALKYIFASVESITYKALIRILCKNELQDKKYYVSICGIFKDEAPYLKEWIEYHRQVGVDHIYLYNNNSTDNYMSVVGPYLTKEGYVTLIDWPYDHAQMEAYHDCFDRFKEETNWLGFIDIDEFIVPIADKKIGIFLEKFKKRPSVLLYWKMFGTSGWKERDVSRSVVRDFTQCWSKYDDIGKCFINTEYRISGKQKIIHHYLWTKVAGVDLPPVNCFDNPVPRDWFNKANTTPFPIQINHYVLKSLDEYAHKCNKTDVFFVKNPKGMEHFNRHESLCTEEDRTAIELITEASRNI